MKIFFGIIIFSLIYINTVSFSQDLIFDSPVKISSKIEKGFYWPYFLFIPDSIDSVKDNLRIFVIPNNTGKTNDTLLVHERSALKTVQQAKLVSKKMNAIVLVPIFPRSSSEWKIYTHALDRDVMLTKNDSLKRLDLQLVAMIEDAREELKEKNILVQDKILMLGFSASGMFVNRFIFLHPELVLAAAIGSPGGWPIVPIREYNHIELNYPVGINDLKEISGKDFNEDELKIVKIYFFLGEEDENDSVVFDDGYDEPERKLSLITLEKIFRKDG
jgi:predicted peptidase